MYIKDEIYYHIESNKLYKIGDKFQVGDEYNYFYDEIINKEFYLNDKDVNELMINKKKNNNYELNSEEFDLVFKCVNDTTMIVRELVFEDVRKVYFNHLPSRLKCMYVTKTLDECYDWLKIFKRTNKQPNQILKLKLSGNIFEGDASFILRQNNKIKEKIKQAHNYWSGIKRDDIKELLFEGFVEVIDVIEI